MILPRDTLKTKANCNQAEQEEEKEDFFSFLPLCLGQRLGKKFRLELIRNGLFRSGLPDDQRNDV